MQKLAFFAGSFLTALFFIPASSQAQTVSIVSGNGQLVCQLCPLNPQRYAPLVVQVVDANNNPLVGVPVTWTLTQPGFKNATQTLDTGATGLSSYTFEPQLEFNGLYFFPAQVSATAGTNTVTFYETTALPYQDSGATAVSYELNPSPPQALSGAVGQMCGPASDASCKPITLSVVGANGPIQGVSVTLVSTSSTKSTVSCETGVNVTDGNGEGPGTVITDVTGTATCIPLFGGAIGSGNYTIVIGGGFASYSPTPFKVTPGSPAIISIKGSATANPNVGVTLTAQVTDASMNPLSGIALKWTVTGPGTLASAGATTGANGVATAVLTATGGPSVQVSVTLPNYSTVPAGIYTLAVNTVITGITATSGNNQSTAAGTAFSEPLSVLLTDGSVPVNGSTVDFAITGSTGNATVTLSQPSAVTALGVASVTATAGTTPGTVTVTATATSGNKTFTQNFVLTINPPYAVITSVVNSAGFQNQFISPCSLATIYATGLTPGFQGIVSAYVEPVTQVAGVTVTFGGVAAPILDVVSSNGQLSVSAQVPCEVPSSSATPPATVPMVLSVTPAGATVPIASPAYPVTVLPYSPGIFGFVDGDGKTRAVLVRPNGSYAGYSNPVARGEVIRMFVTGLGQTTPSLVTDEFDLFTLNAQNVWVPEMLEVIAPVVVGVNNNGVTVTSAHYAYGMVGVYEVDFEVPTDTATGYNAPFAIIVYNGTQAVYGNGSLIAIQ